MRRPKAAIGGDNQQAEKNSVVLDQGERLRFLGLTLSSIAEGVMIVDAQGRLVFMSEAAKRLAQKVPSPKLPVGSRLRHSNCATRMDAPSLRKRRPWAWPLAAVP